MIDNRAYRLKRQHDAGTDLVNLIRSVAPRQVVRVFLAMLSFLFMAGTQAQVTTIHEDYPTNVDCHSAIHICDSTQYTRVNTLDSCLWFKFTVEYEQLVHIEVPVAAEFYAPDEMASCMEFYCTQGPALEVEEVLLPGIYFIKISGLNVHHTIFNIHVLEGDLGCGEIPCEGCLPTFSPLPGTEYIVNAWVKQEGASLGTFHYTTPRILVESPPGTVLETFMTQPGDPMVEGWQLLEGRFIMPSGPFRLSLTCTNGSTLFDDVRMFPADGSMTCYVYDPENLRFVAQLDERHFSTLYEYDNEGKLVRVKKETERGIKTLKETRQNASHRLP